jgi:hypothetical protein
MAEKSGQGVLDVVDLDSGGGCDGFGRRVREIHAGTSRMIGQAIVDAIGARCAYGLRQI